MSDKKRVVSKEVGIKFNYNTTNKKTGYEGVKKQELKTLWSNMSKTQRLYGNTKEANLWERRMNNLDKHWANNNGTEIRRLINITSNSNLLLPKKHDRNEHGNTVKMNTLRAPKDSKRLQEFRDYSDKQGKDFKNAIKKIDIQHKASTIDFLHATILEKGNNSEEAKIITNMINKIGGSFNNAYSKYNTDINRILKSSEISLFEMNLYAILTGIDTKTISSTKLKYK